MTLSFSSATVRLLHTLRALKDHTADLHQLAEQYVRILDADAGEPDYARYLRAMMGFHAPLEEVFASDADLAAAGFEARSRRKAHLLLADLRVVDPDATAPSHCDALPATATLAHRVGAAYVIEGSTLGGKYILSRLPRRLADLRGRATAFLEGYGAETGAQWKRFAAVVEHAIRDDIAERDAIAGARDTFARLIDWLARFERRDARRERAS